MTLEVIRIGGMDLRFLHSKESSEGSLDLFEMTVQPGARVPVAHFHENWDETVYGLRGRARGASTATTSSSSPDEPFS